jgi:hypothetical protein
MLQYDTFGNFITVFRVALTFCYQNNQEKFNLNSDLVDQNQSVTVT